MASGIRLTQERLKGEGNKADSCQNTVSGHARLHQNHDGYSGSISEMPYYIRWLFPSILLAVEGCCTPTFCHVTWQYLLRAVDIICSTDFSLAHGTGFDQLTVTRCDTRHVPAEAFSVFVGCGLTFCVPLSLARGSMLEPESSQAQKSH